jgi:MerR family transcriptional regulator, light-induced transcriptional regulator
MRDSQYEGLTDHDWDGVSLLAKTVVARLVAREPKVERGLVEGIVAMLTDAMISPDPGAFAAMAPLLKKARVTAVDLADSYFPEIARRLGCDWAEDRRSFAHVSIGVARMQAILRDIGADWASADGERPRLGTVLVILPEGEQHSFGAVVLTGQLRRRGVSVRLLLGPRQADLRMLLRERRFDGALLSVSCVEQLGPCRKMVTTLKDATGGKMQVLVGGAVLLNDIDVRAATGADAATSDLTEALVTLGLADACVAAE